MEAEGERVSKALFDALRPLCVKVMSEPSVESLSRLQDGLLALPPGTVIPPHLVPYLTLPLRAAIKRAGSSNERLLESSLLAMGQLLSCVRDMDLWELFHSLFTFLCMLLDSKMAAEAGFSSLSEELCAACLKLLKELFLCSSSSVQDQLFSQFVPVGHCISTLLGHTSSPSHALRRDSLAALCALTGLDTSPLLTAAKLHPSPDDPSDPSNGVDQYLNLVLECVGIDKCRKRHLVASFLPGIAVGVAKLLTSDATAVESVLALGLLTWAHYVVLVMGRAEGEGPAVVVGGAKGEELAGQLGIKVVERTREWEEATADRLSLLTQRVSMLVTSEVWRVRLQLVGWAHVLLQRCSQSLEACVPQLLEVLVTLSHDPYPQVSSAARLALHSFPGGGSGLSSLLSQQLHTLVTSLPRLIRQHDDSKKVVTLQLLAGYLGLTGGHVSLMLHSLPHLSCLVQALVQTLTLQQRGSHMVLVSLPSLDPTHLSSKPLPLVHTHFASEKVAILLCEVCQLLGCHGDPAVLVDYVLDQCHAHSHLRCEYFLLLAYVLRGGRLKGCGHNKETPPPNKGELLMVVEGVVTRLVLPDVWSHDLTNHPTAPSLNSDLYSFLLLYVLYTCVHVVEVDFDPLLQQCLYPLMQKLGDGNVGVADAAMATLQAICHFCQYDAVSALIGRNADYLVHATSVHLCHAPHRGGAHAEAIQVLGAVMRHGEEGVCQMMRDCVRELLISLDTRQLPPTLVWAGLRTLAESCRCWINKRQQEVGSGGVAQGEEAVEEEVKSDRKDVGIEAIADYFRQYHQQKDKQEEGGAESGQEGAGPVGLEQEEEEPYSQTCPLPAVEQVCVDVMSRCGHHMSHHESGVRMVVMDTLEHCMQALSHDTLTLYPEVHTVWPCLLPRLKDPTPPVCRRAWQLLMCMCQVCGDFLRKRVLEKAWPLLVSSLEAAAVTSANSDPLYSQSSKCKLQCVQLECVGSLAASLSLPAVALETGGVVTMPYLSCEQPRPLQEAASCSFRHMIRLNSQLMWLLLQQMVPPPPAIPADPRLKPYKFPAHPDSRKYVDNVSPLLSLTLSANVT